MTESRNFATEYVSNFLTNEPAPGIAYEYELYKKYLNGITLDEVNVFSKKWITDTTNCVVIITAPDKPGLKMPTESKIRSIIGGMSGLDVKPYEDKVLNIPLVDDNAIKAGKIISSKHNDSLDITEWKLSNGVKVLFKPTDFKSELIFSAYSWGGWSLYNEKDFMSAASCDDIVGESGLGAFDATALEKALSGKMVSCNPFVSELQQGMNGSCAPKDMQTLFQLIYKNFTDPRKDTAAFSSYISKTSSALQNRSSDPQSVFGDTVAYALSGYNYRFRPRNADQLKEINLDRSLEIYKERFSNAAEFTFVFVGSAKESDLKPLLEKYIASLPVNQLAIKGYNDIGANPPKGKFERVVMKGQEPKSTVMMRFNMPFDFNRKNRNEVSALSKLMNIRLREVLREEKSGVYGVSFSANPKHYPKQSLDLIIYFSCSPSNAEMLTNAALEVINEVKQKGGDEKNLIKIRETAIRERETALKENQFWMGTINSNDQNREDIMEILQYNDWVKNLTTDDLKSFAGRYLNTDNYSRFVLMPEKQ
jgi:zinc protease